MRPSLPLALLLLAAPALAVGPPPSGKAKADKTIREVAGSAEYLRSVPKRFGTIESVDAARRRVTLRFDGEAKAREWPLIADTEVKIDGWWGRLEQLAAGERVWAWLKTDRKKRPVAVAMLADDLSTQDIRGGNTVKKNAGGAIAVKPEGAALRTLKIANAAGYRSEKKAGVASFAAGEKVYVKGKGGEALLVLDAAALERRRSAQREWLRERWRKEGLPGTVSFVHVFSGELDLTLDHEAMRWGRSLKLGDKVTLQASPPIAAVVKSVTPWRERTQLRLVAKAQELSDLAQGERLRLKMKAPPAGVEDSKYPPDMGRARGRQERIDWFLASVYCTCGVRGDVCTGHFYTLASCNPNGCGMPNEMRKKVASLIDKGHSDKEIFDRLLKEQGPGLLQPHLLP
jgi:hypothetical protein